MFIIEATNAKKHRWISGVFSLCADAEAYLSSVPETARAMQQIVERPVTAYPFFVIEEEGFSYGDIDFVRARLKTLTPKYDEDYIHINIYLLREDFIPTQPGRDEMGALRHWHVDDDRILTAQATAQFELELMEAIGS